MDEDLNQLDTNTLLLKASKASTREEIDNCLSVIAGRKRISNTKLLIPFYLNVWRLATASTPAPPKPETPVSPPVPIYFPDTVIIPSDRRGKPLDADIIFNDYTALFLCGYKVGKTDGLSRNERRDLLTFFIDRPLHPKIIQIFGNEYDEPESMGRLMKVANIIASNCKLRKRRRDAANYAVAIAHYEDDLEFLRERFFVPMSRGQPHLPWPDTEI